MLFLPCIEKIVLDRFVVKFHFILTEDNGNRVHLGILLIFLFRKLKIS